MFLFSAKDIKKNGKWKAPPPVAPPVDSYSQPAATHALARADIQDMDMAYQEESYEDYGQYEAEQEYGDNSNMDTANKGRNKG